MGLCSEEPSWSLRVGVRESTGMTDDDGDGDPFSGPHADRYVAEWLTGMNLLWRKHQRRREAMRPQGPAAAASNEVLANVFQRLPARSAAACRAVCLRWSVLLSSPRFAELAHVGDDTDAGSSTCLAGCDGVSAAGQGRRRRRRGGTMPAATLFTPLPKHQYRRSKKKQGYRYMF